MELITNFLTSEVLDQIFGWILIFGLLFISAVHFYWTAGGKKGLAAAIPVENGRPLFRPGAAATFVIAFGSLLFALVIPGNLGYYQTMEPAFLYEWTPWIVMVIFLFRTLGDFRYMGLFRRVGHSAFAKWDNILYTPLSLLLSVSALVVAYR